MFPWSRILDQCLHGVPPVQNPGSAPAQCSPGPESWICACAVFPWSRILDRACAVGGKWRRLIKTNDYRCYTALPSHFEEQSPLFSFVREELFRSGGRNTLYCCQESSDLFVVLRFCFGCVGCGNTLCHQERASHICEK